MVASNAGHNTQPSFDGFIAPTNPYGLYLVPLVKESLDEELDVFDDEMIEVPTPEMNAPRILTPDDIYESTLALYPFQKTGIAELENGFFIDQLRSQRLILPTGTGKTVTFSTFIKRRIAQNHRVLVLVHRNDLLRQAKDKLNEMNLFPLVEQGDNRAQAHFGEQFRLVVASVQSLHRDRVRLWPRDSFDWIISDECHHIHLRGKKTESLG